MLKEREYLQFTCNKLLQRIADGKLEEEAVTQTLNHENTNYLAQMRYMNLHELSDENRVLLQSQQGQMQFMVERIEELKKEKVIFSNMLYSPYFARLDLKFFHDQVEEKYYLGVHSLKNDEENGFIVLDWRSPIASLFYDYESGEAEILSDNKNIKCELLNKRQYNIKNGKLEYFFDTNITIDDEILKETLSKSSSNKMRSIVQTIQKEQNRIIRSNNTHTLVVNGIAGSGKTAVALHRIAYLLYKLKDKIKAENVAMLSPSTAFSSYISSVLPELAEEDIQKLELDEIARKALKKFLIVERKSEQIERLILHPEQLEEANYKSGHEFLEKLKDFCNNYIYNTFDCNNFEVFGVTINGPKVNKLFYSKENTLSLVEKLQYISEALYLDYFYKIRNASKIKSIKSQIFNHLFGLFAERNCVKLYFKFLENAKMPFVLVKNKVKNEDVYPILFLRYFVYGCANYSIIKHLVVDELQDYSCVQLAVLNMLFDCPMTLLGDTKQSILEYSVDGNLNYLSKIFTNVINYISLNTTYRSTQEITNLFSFVGHIDNVEVVSRKGDVPCILKVEKKSIINITLNEIHKQMQKYKRIAVITKTNKAAKQVFQKLQSELPSVQLIDAQTSAIISDICVISVYNSKGLEFDSVIVHDASNTNYSSEYENNLLYIAISRALHSVSLISLDEVNNKIFDFFDLKLK